MRDELISYVGALEGILVPFEVVRNDEIVRLHVPGVDYKFELVVGLCALDVVDDAAGGMNRSAPGQVTGQHLVS